MTHLFTQENNFGALTVEDSMAASFVAGDPNLETAFKMKGPELEHVPEMKYEPQQAPSPGMR